MPDFPKAYQMRDWKTTARHFDQLVFDQTRKGEFLPLLWMDRTKRVNPTDGFALPTYVGDLRQTPQTNLHEAITGMAACLGATLAGIDKSAWVPMLVTHFHEKNGIGLYLNQVGTRGDSFWYDLLPSLLFGHLYGHYPDAPGFRRQFLSTAETWLRITDELNDDFDHTGYDFIDRKPVDRGWSEADVAAGLACLHYLAWNRTADKRFLEAAQRCLRWMDRRVVNPYYESLAPYGAYASARSNAERGTGHQTAKFVEWTLKGDNPRKWGAILEEWNGTPAHGLIGSVYPEYEYAFAMNTFQAAGVLAPIARYDDRLARDLAKWILNLAANSRFFYPDAWPPEHQSSFDWARRHDPAFCIPYEGIRKQGTTRRYPEEDHMIRGALALGGSTNPDKDMTLTADDRGRVRYEGVVEIADGLSHELIVVLRHRRLEDDVRVYLKDKPGEAIRFKGRKRDDQRLALSRSGQVRVVIEADGLQPGRDLAIHDLVVETRFPDPPHVGGDATVHGWGRTDLGLYGGSYAGFLGALIEPTGVEGILAIDPTATEVIPAKAHPTRLFFNPHDQTHSVQWELGDSEVRVYEAIGNRVLLNSSTGKQSFAIPPKQAFLLVKTPADQPLLRENDRLLCQGIVVDYRP